jgi:hypothetical protein
MEKHIITYKNKKIEFTLIRKNVRNINLRTRADASVMISANEQVPTEFILDFVKKKAPWIYKNQEKYANLQTRMNDSKEYVSGEGFRLLGRQLRLKVYESKDEFISLNADFLEVHVKNKNNLIKKRNLVDEYYKNISQKIFVESMDRMVQTIRLPFTPDIKVKQMISRWGSCVVTKKLIILNSSLIYAPKFCIDYVVLHELLHFENPNHGKKFYKSMTSYMPEWKQCKKLLDEVVVREI